MAHRKNDILQGTLVLLILRTLSAEAGKIQPARDPKLKALVAELKKIVRQAADEATDGLDRIQKRKVLIFSFFADTVNWIRIHLSSVLASDPELKEYAGRLTHVEGAMGGDDRSRMEAVYGFAPISSGSTSSSYGASLMQRMVARP